MSRNPSAPTTTAPAPGLQRLFQARNEWDRLYQLSNLLKEAHIDVPSFFENPEVWQGLCRESDTEMLAWRLAREISRRTEGRLPRSLEPYRSRKDLEAREKSREVTEFRTGLLSWLHSTPPTASSTRSGTVRVVWHFRGESDSLHGGIRIDLCATTGRNQEKPRNLSQIRALCGESQRDPESFSASDVQLLRWVGDHGEILFNANATTGDPFRTPNRVILLWLQTWGDRDLITLSDGTPVRFHPEPAEVAPRLGGIEGNKKASQLEFRVILPGGVEAALAEAHFLFATADSGTSLEPDLLWCRGMFYRVKARPPEAVLGPARRSGAVKLAMAQTQELLPVLLRRYPGVLASIREYVRFVPVRMRFYFSLSEDDMLQISLQAVCKEGGSSWIWGSAGWTSRGRKAGKAAKDLEALPAAAVVEGAVAVEAAPVAGVPAEIWHEMPEDGDTAGAVEWLGRWNAHPSGVSDDPADSGWTMEISAENLPELFVLWQDRNTAWEFFGNRHFQQVFLRKKRPMPKISVARHGVDWFEVSAEWEEDGMKLQPSDWARMRDQEAEFIKLGNGAWVSREEVQALQETQAMLATLGVEVGQGGQKISMLHLAGVQPAAWTQLDDTLAESTRLALQPLRDAVASFEGIPGVIIPGGVRAEMRPYQQTGLDFLAYTGKLGLGAILADDMGLGKTLQALSWLELMREKEGSRPTLVVCPASVVFNWRQEAKQFTPGMKVLTLEAGEGRHALRQEIPKHDLIITNYALLRRDLAELKQFTFRAVILDEAQNIKNPDSLVTKAAKSLASDHRLALTGTPLENRLLDLWSIVDFVQPGYLQSRQQFVEQHERSNDPAMRTLLSTRLRPILLRRKKSQVAQDLPARIEERIDCDLTPEQRKFYLAELQRSRRLLLETGEEIGDPRQRIHVLAALTRLRQICCHPVLAGGKKTLGSGKTTALFELLEPLLEEGHKVLVFSQFVRMLQVLKTELEEKNVPHYLLTGQTRDRAGLVEAFQKETRPSIFLLSLKAAGTGLNLTSASYVVLYDPWWNPAVEAQAIDRTHRIGQDRTVIAYRLVTRHTVEEKIWQLQRQKDQMVQDVLSEEKFTGGLTKSDLEFLLGEETAEPLV